MTIRKGTSKRVSFDTRDKLGDKIDKLTMVMSKLAATENHERRFLSCRYSRGYGIDGNADRIIRGNRSREILEEIEDRIVGKGTEMKGMVTNNNRDRDRSRERAFVGNYRRDRSSGTDRSRSGSRTSTNRDRIRCYACREYDHFVEI